MKTVIMVACGFVAGFAGYNLIQMPLVCLHNIYLLAVFLSGVVMGLVGGYLK